MRLLAIQDTIILSCIPMPPAMPANSMHSQQPAARRAPNNSDLPAPADLACGGGGGNNKPYRVPCELHTEHAGSPASFIHYLWCRVSQS